MCRVGVLFELRHADTRPGEVVSVVGSRTEMGSWDCYTSGLQLRTGASCYPCWAMLAPVWVKPESLDGSMSSSMDRQLSEESAFSNYPGTPGPEREPAATSCGESGVVEDASAPDLPQVLHVEYKYVKDRRQLKDHEGPSIQWEDSIVNRSVTLPFEPGSIWIVSDSKFNDAREPPRITRTTLVEILAHSPTMHDGPHPPRLCQGRDELDMETRQSHPKDFPAPEWSGWEHEDDESSLHSGGTSFSQHTTSTLGIPMH
ncbi:unnamed protein product [Polarella glacialis]|nr:unnamed protein product [Polarella glacialis]